MALKFDKLPEERPSPHQPQSRSGWHQERPPPSWSQLRSDISQRGTHFLMIILRWLSSYCSAIEMPETRRSSKSSVISTPWLAICDVRACWRTGFPKKRLNAPFISRVVLVNLGIQSAAGLFDLLCCTRPCTRKAEMVFVVNRWYLYSGARCRRSHLRNQVQGVIRVRLGRIQKAFIECS